MLNKVSKPKGIGNDEYDHYIALDWSKTNMAIARMTPSTKEPKVVDRESSLGEFKLYLKELRGRKILTIEETSTAQWLYTELLDCVDRIIICDPYRNKLLSDGPKNDRIDARKLCLLLRGGLLKEVYHSTEKLYELRKHVSTYQDLVRASVRAMNQRFAVYHSNGYTNVEEPSQLQKSYRFITQQLDERIVLYEEHKTVYHNLFTQWCKKHREIRNLMAIPGIGMIGAVKIMATVITAHRFANKGHYLAYCGLVKHQKMSGNRNYGQRSPRYSRTLKEVYKMAALQALRGKNPIRDYYDHLIGKGLAAHHARHAVARYIAAVTYGMLKHGEKFEPYRWRKETKI